MSSMGIGFGEIVVILVVILVFVKPEDISKTARGMAKFVATARSEGAKFLKELKEPVDSVVDPIKEVQNEINDTIQSIKEGGDCNEDRAD